MKPLIFRTLFVRMKKWFSREVYGVRMVFVFEYDGVEVVMLRVVSVNSEKSE